MAIFELLAKMRMVGADKVDSDLKKTKASATTTAKSMEQLGSSTHKAETAFRSFGDVAKKALAGSAVAGVGAFAIAAQYDSLTRALATVSESATDLTGKLGRLQQIAKLPGLNFAQAVQGVTTLQSAGLSANLAERAVASFGNALASVGKGSAELERVITALSQIKSKGVVSAEEIGQLAETLPMIRKLLQGAFGTSNTELIQRMGITATDAIARIVAEAEKLPRVSGGIGNALENLADLAQRTLLPLGQGLAAGLNGAMPALEKYLGAIEGKLRGIGEYIAALGNSGVLFDALNKFGKGIGDLFGLAKVNLESFAAGAISFIANLPGDIAKVLRYTGDVLSTAIANIGIAFDYAGRLVDSIGQRIESIGERIRTVFSGLINTAQNLSQFNFKGAIQSLSGALAAGMAASPVLAVPRPEFAQFPQAPKLTGWSDGARYQAMINAAKRPLPVLPDNLTFGGAGALQAVATPSLGALSDTRNEWMERLLAGIEKNTRSTADILSLRKQGFGGGPLATVGVTSTELRGGRVSGNAPTKEDYGRRPASTGLEYELRRIIRGETNSRFGLGRRIV